MDAVRDAAESTAEIAGLWGEAAAATVRSATFTVEEAEADLAFSRFHSFPGGAVGYGQCLGGAAERAMRVDRLQQLDAPLGEDHVPLAAALDPDFGADLQRLAAFGPVLHNGRPLGPSLVHHKGTVSQRFSAHKRRRRGQSLDRLTESRQDAAT
jgi:hypothetical protein